MSWSAPSASTSSRKTSTPPAAARPRPAEPRVPLGQVSRTQPSLDGSPPILRPLRNWAQLRAAEPTNSSSSWLDGAYGHYQSQRDACARTSVGVSPNRPLKTRLKYEMSEKPELPAISL